MCKLEKEKLLLLELCRPIKYQSFEKINKMINFKKIDWDKFLEISKQQKIASYISISLESLNLISLLPSNVKDEFEKIKTDGELRISIFDDILCQVVTSLREINIDPIPMKGPIFYHLLYENNGLRLYYDLDFMIKKCDHKKVKMKMNEIGIFQGEINKETGEILQYSEEYIEEYLLHSKHAAEYIMKKENMIIFFDIHHSLFWPTESYKIDYEDLIDYSQKININDIDITRQSDIDVLLHTCIHSYWHSTKLYQVFEDNDLHLKQYQDIYLAIDAFKDTLDWKMFLERVDKLKMFIPAGVSLLQTEEVFGKILPDDVRNHFNTDEIKNLINAIYDPVSKKDDKPVAYWDIPLLFRIFDTDRASKLKLDKNIVEELNASSSWFKKKTYKV